MSEKTTAAFTTIEYEQQDGVAIVKLNRPEVLNSLTRTLSAELLSAFEEAEKDPETKCVLLTGNGRGFCAGQDLQDIEHLDGKTVRGIVHNQCAPLVRFIHDARLPYVCAVNGVAAGAGANLALGCDIVIASTQASFIQSFVHIGLIPDTGGTYFLGRMVGIPRAKALAMLGEKLPAEEAERWGMIYKTCAPEELLKEAMSICTKLASLPSLGVEAAKQALQASYVNTFEEQLALEEELQAELGDSADFREGVQAFLEKRKPMFRGN